jgi:hypothetical protein
MLKDSLLLCWLTSPPLSHLIHCDLDYNFMELPWRNQWHMRIFRKKNRKRSTFGCQPGVGLIRDELHKYDLGKNINEFLSACNLIK